MSSALGTIQNTCYNINIKGYKMVNIRDSKGRYVKGIKGHSKGRPKEDKTKLREVDNLMQEKGIIFDGDFKTYGLKYLECLSEIGLHTILWEELLKFGPYLQGKKSNIEPEKTDNEMTIMFSNEEVLESEDEKE